MPADPHLQSQPPAWRAQSRASSLHPVRGASGHFWQHRRPSDWLFAALVLVAGIALGWRLGGIMDGYEQAILIATVPVLIALGWQWRALARLWLGVCGMALIAISLYQGDVLRAEKVFWLKYLLSSQSAILWMCALVFLSAGLSWLGLLLPHPQTVENTSTTNTAQRLGLWLSWAAVALALIGTLVRWHESYLLAPGMGHIPISNLYEVLVLFVWMTLLLGLYFEKRFQAHGLMAFVLLIVGAAVAFLLWYALTRQAHLIQPLVPALQSWWMKLHVPANFVGYGCFVLAAMAALAWLLKTASSRALWIGLVGSMVVLTAALAVAGYVLPMPADKLPALQRWLRMVGGLAMVCALLVAARQWINPRTPSLALLDEVMYQTIALGFVFFTLATVLGALWAAEAWGAYWSNDPKEIWALVVWINYAAWLHLRLMKGMRGKLAAWWALVGLVIVTFAFIGVNLFLGGLHSYGRL